MSLSTLGKSVLLIVSMSCVAQAYLIPGQPGGQVGGVPQYQPGAGNGNGDGWVDPGSGADPSPYDPSPYDPQPGYGGQDSRSIYLQRRVTNERLDLRALAGLNSSYRGWEILSVRANIQSTNSGRTIVQLVADGRVIATQNNAGSQIYLTPQMRTVLDSNVRSLQLVVNGSAYFDTIEIDLSGSQNGGPQYPPTPEPPPYPGNPGYPGQPGNPGYGQQQVDIDVYRNLNGNDRIDLTQYVQLSRYRGYAIEQVIIQGTASYNTAFINVLINGNNMGQAPFTGGYSQQQSVWLGARPVIGRGADSIVLYSSGQMTVERVTLVLSN